MTPQLQLTAADAGCRYGETDTVMCVVINVVTQGDRERAREIETLNFCEKG